MVRPQHKEFIMRTATPCQQHRLALELEPAAMGLRGRLGRVARRWWRAYWDRRARKATLLILQSLDERTLHDIGISPSEIESCVYGRWRDRRRPYDANWRR
jgi:uncharacterized protein YjiS (DUF1127 family)